MIGRLKGTVDSVGAESAIIDVHGVGYLVHCATHTLQDLRAGEAAVLAIETQVRESDIRLFGFVSDIDREWFRLLQLVQGVGAKLALAILSTLRSGDLASAIALQDRTTIARAPGVGAKMAARICVELKDKAPTFAVGDPMLARLQSELGDRAAPPPVADAVSALVNLGYGQAQAAAAISAALREAGDGAEASRLIRLGLKELAR